MTDPVNVTIGGTVAPGFEGVRDAIAANFAPGFEVGASAAVYLHGRSVVDLWGGSFEQGSDRPYDDQTLQLVFSTTKGVAATAVAMCVARGLLSYDEKVSHYWPDSSRSCPS
jgi:CubicO group peptidase (beta-lactamase class C family)